MKKHTMIFAAFLFSMLGCGEKKADNNNFITIDVLETDYPKKELILQDFMDVEYIALETNDEFVNQGVVLDVGENFMLLRNRSEDGNIFIYDRTGKAIRKINRKGQSGEEYSNIWGITLDEDNNELFVNSQLERKILVYDLYGNFKRSFEHQDGGGTFFYTHIFNYDRDNLICNNEYSKKIGFVLISKKDGSITKEIKIPFREKTLLLQYIADETNNSLRGALPGPYRTMTLHNGNWLLLELSSDTIYSFSPDYNLRPFMVRTPSIQSMKPEVFLVLRLFSDRYYFMETIKNVYDWDTELGFSRTFFMYDTQERSFFRYAVYNGDFSIQKEVYMSATMPVNYEIESWYPLEAHELVKAYKEGQLRGKLKEIAATLNEESNPVIMLIKHKK